MLFVQSLNKYCSRTLCSKNLRWILVTPAFELLYLLKNCVYEQVNVLHTFVSWQNWIMLSLPFHKKKFQDFIRVLVKENYTYKKRREVLIPFLSLWSSEMSDKLLRSDKIFVALSFLSSKYFCTNLKKQKRETKRQFKFENVIKIIPIAHKFHISTKTNTD